MNGKHQTGRKVSSKFRRAAKILRKSTRGFLQPNEVACQTIAAGSLAVFNANLSIIA